MAGRGGRRIIGGIRLEKSHLNLSWFLRGVTNIEFIELYLFSKFKCDCFTINQIFIEYQSRGLYLLS